jgi:hypothetical protein
MEINQDTPVGEVPSKVREVVKLFKAYGFTKWRYIKNYKLPNGARHIQVRTGGYKDKTTVEKYADDIRNGDDFPPVVVDDSGNSTNNGGMLIDGVHRTLARERLRQEHVEAIILTGVKYETSSDIIKVQLRLLAQKANAQHGKKSTADDARESAMEYLAINPTVKPAKLAQMLSVSLATGKILIAEYNVKNRIAELKPKYPRLEEIRPLSSREGLNQSVMKLLNAHPAWGFSHPIWVELIHLIDDARMKEPDAKDIINRLGTTFSDGEKEDILTRERETYADKMDGGALNGKRDVSGHVLFRRAKAMILGRDNQREEFRIEYLIPHNKELVPSFMKEARDLRNFLNRLIASEEDA